MWDAECFNLEFECVNLGVSVYWVVVMMDTKNMDGKWFRGWFFSGWKCWFVISDSVGSKVGDDMSVREWS